MVLEFCFYSLATLVADILAELRPATATQIIAINSIEVALARFQFQASRANAVFAKEDGQIAVRDAAQEKHRAVSRSS